MAKKKITQERADEILELLDMVYAELFEAGLISQGNTLMGLCDELVDIFEEQANDTNPFSN